MRIVEVATTLGENAIDLNERYNLPALIEKTGISTVYETDLSTTKLAAKAANQLKLLEKNLIQAMFLVTQSPDDFLPANAISLANEFLLPQNLLTMDFNQGCSGFVQGLTICEKLLLTYENILLVTADRY